MLFYEGDVGNTLNFPVRRKDGSPYDLTAATVTLIVPTASGGPFSCTVSGNVASYVVQAGNFPAGKHQAQLKTVKSGVILYTDPFQITVERVLG